MSESMFGVPVRRDSGALVALCLVLLIVCAAIVPHWNGRWDGERGWSAAFACAAIALAAIVAIVSANARVDRRRSPLPPPR